MKTKNDFLKMTNEEFDHFIYMRFPDMMQNRKKTVFESCLGRGFEINKGWYFLIYDMCLHLEEIQKKIGVLTIFDQIKEKFATGRFYFHCVNLTNLSSEDFQKWESIITMIVSHFEYSCGKTDEITGEYISKPLIVNNWYYAMSEETYKKELLKNETSS